VARNARAHFPDTNRRRQETPLNCGVLEKIFAPLPQLSVDPPLALLAAAGDVCASIHAAQELRLVPSGEIRHQLSERESADIAGCPTVSLREVPEDGLPGDGDVAAPWPGKFFAGSLTVDGTPASRGSAAA
jgi:hypothetical protein